jgi:hypothetical protein
MPGDNFLREYVQRHVNRVVLAKMDKMAAEADAERARERRALRWLLPALLLIALSYLLIVLLA